jgi:hypothetical protein
MNREQRRAAKAKPRRPVGPPSYLLKLADAAAQQTERAALRSKANPDAPAPAESQALLIATMASAIESIKRGKNPTEDDWRTVADLPNIIEAMIRMGYLSESDAEPHLNIATTGLVDAKNRANAGKGYRLNGEALSSMSHLLDIYTAALEQLTERETVEIMLNVADFVRAAYRAMERGEWVVVGG